MITGTVKKAAKKILKPFFRRFQDPIQYTSDSRWVEVNKKLSQSKTIVDLGCGNNPVKGATVAVDQYVEPKERICGFGPTIDLKKMEQQNIRFVNTRVDAPLPFKDKEFDFAYSHHAFEHFENLRTACDEMMRIAKAGAIITPSIFAEFIFGRSYHRWMVMQREDMLLFFKKRAFEDRPFGEHPRWDEDHKKWVLEEQTNPFEILLNDENWYQGREGMPRLSNTIRKHWYGRTPLMEVVFLWESSFKYQIYE